MPTDQQRLDALQAMGNIAIWNGHWGQFMGAKAGRPVVTITAMDDDAVEYKEQVAQGETLRDALDTIAK